MTGVVRRERKDETRKGKGGRGKHETGTGDQPGTSGWKVTVGANGLQWTSVLYAKGQWPRHRHRHRDTRVDVVEE